MSLSVRSDSPDSIVIFSVVWKLLIKILFPKYCWFPEISCTCWKCCGMLNLQSQQSKHYFSLLTFMLGKKSSSDTRGMNTACMSTPLLESLSPRLPRTGRYQKTLQSLYLSITNFLQEGTQQMKSTYHPLCYLVSRKCKIETKTKNSWKGKVEKWKLNFRQILSSVKVTHMKGRTSIL